MCKIVSKKGAWKPYPRIQGFWQHPWMLLSHPCSTWRQSCQLDVKLWHRILQRCNPQWMSLPIVQPVKASNSFNVRTKYQQVWTCFGFALKSILLPLSTATLAWVQQTCIKLQPFSQSRQTSSLCKEFVYPTMVRFLCRNCGIKFKFWTIWEK